MEQGQADPQVAGARALALRGETTGVEPSQPGAGKVWRPYTIQALPMWFLRMWSWAFLGVAREQGER